MSAKAVEEYNKLFQTGKLKFGDFDFDELPRPVRAYLVMWVVYFNVGVKLHKPIIDGEYLFQLDHPKVKYLFCNEEPDPTGPPGAKGTHMWGDAEFENIENNVALAEIGSSAGVDKEKLRSLFEDLDG